MTLPAGKGERGFTLFELMLVLLLLGLAAVIVFPSINRGLKNRDARRAALGFAATARELAERARTEGVPQRLIIDKARNSYRIGRQHEIELPAALSIAAVHGGEILESGLHGFNFYPNGATFGGRVDFSAAADGILYSVRLHPLTGRIEVLRGAGS